MFDKTKTNNISIDQSRIRLMSDDVADATKIVTDGVKTVTRPVAESAINKQDGRLNNPFLSTGVSNNKKDNNNLTIDSEAQSQSNKKPVVYALLAAFFIMVIGAAGYYFWMTRVQLVQEDVSINNDVAFEGNNSDNINIPEDENKFSSNKPNIVILDDLSELKINYQMAEYIPVFRSTAPYSNDESVVYEFNFAQKDNPEKLVTTKEFVSNLKLLFSASVIEQFAVDGTAKLYYYNNNNSSFTNSNSIVVGLEIKNRDAVLAAMKKNEIEFLSKGTIEGIFIEGERKYPAPGKFSDSNYNGYSIRYFNFDGDDNNSIDYSFRRNTLLIGTSKNAIRATLDWLDQKK